ncbi:MAG: GreA/GreB family elongation factor [Burkholderiales bacterium]|nr:GreA/GreB family elongation factor [Burkholderiales bacterium]
MNVQARERVLTELDHVRLAALSSRRSKDRSPRPMGIDAVLDDARVVPSRRIAPDIVTMYSQVVLRFTDEGPTRKLTLCYPEDAEPELGFVSILSPIGLSLLGQQVGAIVRWKSPDGSERMAEVNAILFQPEASGDYTT